MNVIMMSRGADHIVVFRIPAISMISLIKLIEGGTAMFAAVSRNHSIVIEGKRFRSPFVRKILRVWVVS